MLIGHLEFKTSLVPRVTLEAMNTCEDEGLVIVIVIMDL